MELSDVTREHVEEALSERVGSIGFAGPELTVMLYIAGLLEKLVEAEDEIVLADIEEGFYSKHVEGEFRPCQHHPERPAGGLTQDGVPLCNECIREASDEELRGEDHRVFRDHADRRMAIEDVKRLIQQACPLEEYMDAERLAEAIVDGPLSDRLLEEQERDEQHASLYVSIHETMTDLLDGSRVTFGEMLGPRTGRIDRQSASDLARKVADKLVGWHPDKATREAIRRDHQE